MLIVRSLVGRDRHALQTQFPPSGIELRNGPQFRLPSFHSASITAAAANPSATPINGLRTANQKEMFQSEFSGVGFVFMPLSQAFKDRNFTKHEASFGTLNELSRTWIVASGLGSSKGYSHPAKKYIRPVFMFGHLSGNRIPDVLIAWNEPDRRSDGEIVENFHSHFVVN